jgi:deoxycytidylate deaminase
MNRPTIDVSLMAVAEVWAERSTCSRNHVGVVIARNGRTIGSGYNGAPAGMAHCEHTEAAGWRSMRKPMLSLTPRVMAYR